MKFIKSLSGRDRKMTIYSPKISHTLVRRLTAHHLPADVIFVTVPNFNSYGNMHNLFTTVSRKIMTGKTRWLPLVAKSHQDQHTKTQLKISQISRLASCLAVSRGVLDRQTDIHYGIQKGQGRTLRRTAMHTDRYRQDRYRQTSIQTGIKRGMGKGGYKEGREDTRLTDG